MAVYAFRVERTIDNLAWISRDAADFSIAEETSFTFALITSICVDTVGVLVTVIEYKVNAFIDVDAHTINLCKPVQTDTN